MDTDLDQIQEDWAGRNFMTISSVNPLLIIKECRDESQIYNYHGFNFRFMNSLMEYGGRKGGGGGGWG